jgi:hypothetical protein
LKGILEHRDFLESDCKPAIVVLPELAVPFSDIPAARAAISGAPKGTLVVFGAGQMTEAEALSLENKPDLWDGESAGKYANCAVIGLGGCDRVFLQPKLLKSALEQTGTGLAESSAASQAHNGPRVGELVTRSGSGSRARAASVARRGRPRMPRRG